MELRPRDTYKVQYGYGLSAAGVRSLTELYLPLLHRDAYVVYLLLAAESEQTSRQPVQRLLTMADLDIRGLEKALLRLEEYLLLSSYVRETDKGNHYIYMLKSPMHSQDFFKSSIYRGRYEKTVGPRNMENTRSRLEAAGVSLEGYRDITHPVSYYHEDEITEEYTEVKPRYAFSDDTTIAFDYAHFIATTSTLVFPAELRTTENMNLIGKVATFYGLSADTMRILVKRSTDVDTMEFHPDTLLFLAESAKPQEAPVKDRYSLSPVSFLQSLQNGAQVTRAEKKILEHLSMDMNFSNEVINVMIEYILKISANRLNSKFVDSVAGEWARDGITTKEQAVAETQKKLPQKSRGHASVRIDTPEWYKKQQSGETGEAARADDDLIRQFEEMKNSMKGDADEG
ncbi:MAG: DnaD domain protein [Solobacterium sp.]|nr:DnaD domain protein [Solobacterium sp.]